MAEQFYTILTAIGKAKFANSSALGTKLNLTQFAVGDSNGKYYNPTETQASLVNEVWRGNIGSISIDTENPNWIVIEVTIPSLHGGFMIREGGIFDIEGDLIAIAKYPETYKPVAADGSTKDLVIRMILEVSNTSSVTLKVDPTVILSTKKDILDIKDSISEHEKKSSSTTQVGHVKLNNTLTSTSSTEALTAAQGKVLKDAFDTQKAEIVKKPVSAIGNNVAIFDTNQDKIKDSGFTIGKSIPSDAEFTDTIYVHPTTHPASIIAVEDAGNIITANNVEGALQEVATNIKSNSEDIYSLNTDIKSLNKFKRNVVIGITNWIQDAITGLYKYKIQDSDITADTVVNVNIKATDLEKAEDFKSANESFLGYVEIYSESVPTSEITCDLVITRQVI